MEQGHRSLKAFELHIGDLFFIASFSSNIGAAGVYATCLWVVQRTLLDDGVGPVRGIEIGYMISNVIREVYVHPFRQIWVLCQT